MNKGPEGLETGRKEARVLEWLEVDLEWQVRPGYEGCQGAMLSGVDMPWPLGSHRD